MPGTATYAVLVAPYRNLAHLVHTVDVALVVVVVHCHLWFELGGSGVGVSDSDEVVDPMVCAENENGLGTVPGQTAQLATLPRLVLVLVQPLHRHTDAWRQVTAVGTTDTTRPDTHLQQIITQGWGSVQVIEIQDAVQLAHGRTRLITV